MRSKGIKIRLSKQQAEELIKIAEETGYPYSEERKIEIRLRNELGTLY